MSKHNFGRLLHDLSHGEYAVDHRGLKPRRPPPVKPPIARISQRHRRRRSWLAAFGSAIGIAVVVAALIPVFDRQSSAPPVATQAVAMHQERVNDVVSAPKPIVAIERPQPPKPAPIVNKIAPVATQHVASRRLYRLRSSFELQQELERNVTDIGADRDGLPILGDSDCHVAHSTLAKTVSSKLAMTQRSLQGASQSVDVSAEIRMLLDTSYEWRQRECVTTLNQILQIEDDPVRWMLVESLASVPGPEASRALADRAIYDLSHYVRDAATDALKKRPLSEYRQQLLKGFRYPWPEVACNAAEACVELGHVEFIDALTAMLDEPDPNAASRSSDGAWTRNELVRMNHLSNCTLCHAKAPAAARTRDSFIAAIPIRGKSLPFLYYQADPSDEVIQVDVVYLRQDFSMIHIAKEFAPWPEQQRYDYFVRKRRLTDAEIAEAEATKDHPSTSYPQRDAVMLALMRLQASQSP